MTKTRSCRQKPNRPDPSQTSTHDLSRPDSVKRPARRNNGAGPITLDAADWPETARSAGKPPGRSVAQVLESTSRATDVASTIRPLPTEKPHAVVLVRVSQAAMALFTVV